MSVYWRPRERHIPPLSAAVGGNGQKTQRRCSTKTGGKIAPAVRFGAVMSHVIGGNSSAFFVCTPMADALCPFLLEVKPQK